MLRSNTKSSSEMGKLPEFSHDKSAGGEAETGNDGKRQLDGHHSIQNIIQACKHLLAIESLLCHQN